jgi:protein kinase C substrate 80K-H
MTVYVFQNYLPPSLRLWLDDKLRELKTMLVANGILADNGGSSSDNTESRKVTDARQRVEVAQKDLENQRKELKEKEDDLAADFGPDDIFRALKGTCIESDSGEYTYEHCFLQSTTQKSKKGGGHTDMGRYVRMERITVDEEIGSDGKGVGKGERIALKYENGQHCWNGPLRSTTAVLACSETNEIWKIVEEEKCVYRMDVGTPAVCGIEDGAAPAGTAAARDEL